MANDFRCCSFASFEVQSGVNAHAGPKSVTSSARHAVYDTQLTKMKCVLSFNSVCISNRIAILVALHTEITRGLQTVAAMHYTIRLDRFFIFFSCTHRGHSRSDIASLSCAIMARVMQDRVGFRIDMETGSVAVRWQCLAIATATISSAVCTWANRCERFSVRRRI